ncbi:MAG: hypothetical protein ABIJ47_10895 [Candidatus Bathyarchaeota archaeon]
MLTLERELVDIYRSQLLRVAEAGDLSGLSGEDQAILREAGVLVEYLDWKNGGTYTGLSPDARRVALRLPSARIIRWRVTGW